MIRLFTIALLCSFCLLTFGQKEFQIKGIVLDEDSTSVLPFAYAINKKTGNGVVTDFNGYFTIKGTNNDTITISLLGYNSKTIAVKNIKNINDSTKQFLKIILTRQVYNLSAINITTFKIKPYEREYMERVLNQPKLTGISVLESPFTALYDQFSHKGRANRKLQALFEQMFIDEMVASKFNPDILKKLTGDENIDFQKFKKYCYSVSDQFILNHDGYDLYKPIMDCYKRWKSEGR